MPFFTVRDSSPMGKCLTCHRSFPARHCLGEWESKAGTVAALMYVDVRLYVCDTKYLQINVTSNVFSSFCFSSLFFASLMRFCKNLLLLQVHSITVLNAQHELTMVYIYYICVCIFFACVCVYAFKRLYVRPPGR